MWSPSALCELGVGLRPRKYVAAGRTMEATKENKNLIFIKDTLRLSSQDLAKSLGVSSITVTRWEQGTSTPTGLQAEVLQGLYNVALTIERNRDQQRAEMVRGLVLLGIGALIFYLLVQASQSGN